MQPSDAPFVLLVYPWLYGCDAYAKMTAVMTAYRDDLEAAQRRIHALEQELAALKRKHDASGIEQGAPRPVDITPVDQQRFRVPTYVWIVLPLVLLLFSERIPRLFSISGIFFVFVPVALLFKGRSRIRANDDEVLLITSDDELTGWVGPGESTRLRASEKAYRLALEPLRVSVRLAAVALAQGPPIDLVVSATARFDVENYKDGESDPLHRALLVLGFPPNLAALSGLLRDAVDEPIRQAATRRTREQIERVATERTESTDSTTSPLLAPLPIDLDQFKRRYGIELRALDIMPA